MGGDKVIVDCGVFGVWGGKVWVGIFVIEVKWEVVGNCDVFDVEWLL